MINRKMSKTVLVSVVFLLLVSLIVFADTPVPDEVNPDAIPEEVQQTKLEEVVSEPKPDDINGEFMKNCGNGVCEPPETKERCCEDCGGCFSDVKKAGDEIVEEKEKKSFFSRIIDFFRKLFGKQTLQEFEVKCPDDICDDLEMREGVCPQDCKGIEGWGEKTEQSGGAEVKELVDEKKEEIIDESQYVYNLAEFIQKQQTFSPYTKYEPNFVVDKAHNKIYYVFKAMDNDDLWQIWTATSDLDGNNWQDVQQTDSSENKQRPFVIYDPKDNLLHYFYRTGSEFGAAEKITRRLITAIKKPNEEKWHDEKVLIDNDEIDDTTIAVLDSIRHRIILAYTKNSQITTARINLNDGSFKEITHTSSNEMSFIPNMAYDESSDVIYLVFPRARTSGTMDNKDLWLARLNGDGSNYRETRLTKTDYDNTWPFITLDLPRKQFYVYYSSFTEPTSYSEEGVANVKERVNLGRANLDGIDWKVLLDKNGFGPFGVNPKTGVLYGLYEEPYKEMHQGEGNTRYFVVYNPDNGQMEKQLIPSGDKQTDYDASHKYWDSESKRIFGAQQVCHPAGDRAMECQIWTYHGRVLDNENSSLVPQDTAEVAPMQERKLPQLKIIGAEGFNDKIKINTNRKLSWPIEIKIVSKSKEVVWKPENMKQIDQDKGVELRFPSQLTSYEASYKICALSDPANPECLEGTVKYP